MDKERRFISFENSYSIYKKNDAMFIGTVYFSKGYQSTPVLAMQFAKNVSETDEKRFDWNLENTFYFPSYNQIFELYARLKFWHEACGSIAKSGKSAESFSEIANSKKISNPKKQTFIYMIPSVYEGSVYLKMNYSKRVTIVLTMDELSCLLMYVKTFLDNYHLLCLTHRMMLGNNKNVPMNEQNNDFVVDALTPSPMPKSNGQQKKKPTKKEEEDIISVDDDLDLNVDLSLGETFDIE